LVPSGQALNIRWKHVLRRARDAHFKDRLEQYVVRGCAARPILGGNADV
jgi:hypothetical protein